MDRLKSNSGFSLMELMVAFVIAAFAIVAAFSSFIDFDRVRQMNKAKLLAMEGARAKIEELRQITNIQEVLEAYYPDNLNFPISKLGVQKDDDDGYVGKIVFPVGSDGKIWESLNEPLIGLPFDLNMNGDIDDGVDDYVVLPVRIEVDWRDFSGTYQYSVFTYLRGIEE